MYGKPGAFRSKPYGLEYRTISNQWTKNAELIDYVYKQTLYASEFVNSMNTPNQFLRKYEETIYLALNGEKEARKMLTSGFNIALPSDKFIINK